MLKRLFIKLPLFILFFVVMITGIIPLIYWIITGNSIDHLYDKIDDL
jgi:hypothetical protein